MVAGIADLTCEVNIAWISTLLVNLIAPRTYRNNKGLALYVSRFFLQLVSRDLLVHRDLDHISSSNCIIEKNLFRNVCRQNDYEQSFALTLVYEK